ncbi:MAG: hypothetical protein ACRDTI_05845 [Mycobacterium sp.]
MSKFNLELSSKEALIVTVGLKLLSAEALGPKYLESNSPEAIASLITACNAVMGRIGAEAAKQIVEAFSK